MDEAGIDIQVLSHGAPSTQKLPPETAAAMATRVNDRLAAIVAKNPTRFAAFAALPTAVPDAAADELERTAALGFKGAMLHGLANGTFLDDKKFWPIFARAEKLDLPIYLHPGLPHADVIKAYYADYVKDFPMITRATWGYTVETATLAIRLVLSGVFEKHPKLKIILGHLGETLPFLVWRVDHTLARPGQKSVSFRDIFCNNFYVTTSGNFSNPALLVLRHGNGHRPHPLCRGLALRHEPAGDQMDGNRAALRRGQGEDPFRQRQAVVEDVASSSSPVKTGEVTVRSTEVGATASTLCTSSTAHSASDQARRSATSFRRLASLHRRRPYPPCFAWRPPPFSRGRMMWPLTPETAAAPWWRRAPCRPAPAPGW